MTSAAVTAGMVPAEGFATLPAEMLAGFARTSVRSARRWIREHRMPAMAHALLELLLRGPLERISPEWAGWYLRRDELHSPEGYCFRPAELRALPIRMQQLAALESEVQQLRARQAIEQQRNENDIRPQRQPRGRDGDGLHGRLPALTESAVFSARWQPTLSCHVSYSASWPSQALLQASPPAASPPVPTPLPTAPQVRPAPRAAGVNGSSV